MLNKLLIFISLFIALGLNVKSHASNRGVDVVINRGLELFNHGRWSDARLTLQKAREMVGVDQNQQRELVDCYLAACAVELDSEDAAAALRQFEINYPSSLFNNDIKFSLASFYCTVGNMSEAKRHFKEVDYHTLNSIRKEQYNIRMGYVEFAEGNYDTASDYFMKLSRASSYADHATYYLSYIDYAKGDYNSAKQSFQSLENSDAYGELIPYYMLQIEFKQGNYSYVVENGPQLIDQTAASRRLELRRVMAESQFHLGEYSRSIEQLKEYLNTGGVMGRDENYLMGFSLYRTARYIDAVPYLRLACGADDALTQNASFHLADCYVRSGDKANAMKSFAMASSDKFDATIAQEALFNYAKLQYELGGGLFSEAINLLTRYIDHYPKSDRLPQVRALLVAAYYNSQNYDAAYKAIKSLSNPDAEIKAALQKIAYFRGLESYKGGNLTEASRFLKESATVGVSAKFSALNYFWQGEIAFAQGDYEGAKYFYQSYIRRAPSTAREHMLALYNLGYCAFSSNEMSEANKYFTKFISLHPFKDAYYADALNRIGDCYYADRDFEAAIKEYDKAVVIGNNERYYAQYKRAIAVGILGNIDSKINSLLTIISRGGGDYVDDATYELGRTYILDERYSEGAAILEKFISEFPNSAPYASALSDLGLAYLNLGDKERSLKYYDMVVVASPKSSEARDAMQGIREIYVADGEVDKFFDYAKQRDMVSDMTEMTRDSLSFISAQKIYLNGKYSIAEKSLRNYIKSYPQGYYITDVLFYLSDCYLKNDDRNFAIDALQDLVEHPANQYSEMALDRLSSMTFADKRYGEAASAYRKLFEVASNNAEKEQAILGYVRSILKEGDKDEIEKMAKDIAAQKNIGDIPFRESQFAYAEQLTEQKRHAEALVIYKKLGGEVESEQGSISAYRVLESIYDSGDMDRAERAIYDYADKNPPHSYWLAKAYILLGDIYASKGDSFQARATYQSVADGYSPADDGIIGLVKERIAKLSKEDLSKGEAADKLVAEPVNKLN